MDEVADGLFVGTVGDAGDESYIRECNISNIVSLTYEEPEGVFPSDVTVVNVPMMDGPRNDQQKFGRAVNLVSSYLQSDETVLVHCSAGASRSPTVAATALALYSEVELETAFEQVASNRNAVDPHEALLRQAAHVFVQFRE